MFGTPLVFLGLIIFLFVGFQTNLTAIENRNNNATIVPVSENIPCKPSLSTLTNITDTECCVQSGVLTAKKLITIGTDLEVIIEPSSNPKDPLTICSAYCTIPVDTSVFPPTCNSDMFTECFSLLNPTNCNSAVNPIAYANITYYYVSEVGSANCSETSVCANLI